MSKITVKETVYVDRPPEEVWDYTQNYACRATWDKSIISAVTIATDPRRIKIVAKGGMTAELEYKLDDRPRRTSLAMVNTVSPFISGGGGSWDYEPDGAGTLWTQTNTLVVKDGFMARLLKPLIAAALKKNTLRAMKLAKKILESGRGG